MKLGQMNADKAAAALPEHLAKSSIHRLYKLGAVLSEDITGTLYVAGVKVLAQEAAVYVLAPGCSIVSRQLLRLDHPNICRVHRVMTLKDGTSAIIIERPEGRPILTFAEKIGRLGLNQSISAVLQLLSSLHAVHLTGKTVRNLNVNNLFLHEDADGNLRLKLVSVGIDGPKVNLKAPHYLSPERIMDVDKGDPLADIWAAGAVLYHLCYGRPPFAGDNEVELAKNSMLETPDFNAADRSVPDALADIIRRALHRDERKRYQNVSEMVSELLPLRDVYYEPMSEDVSCALKHSCPPPPSASEKLVPEKTSSTAAVQRAPDRFGRGRSNDTTAEYGTEKSSASKRDKAVRFFGTPLSPKSQGRPTSQKSLGTPRSANKTSMTLLGIPAPIVPGVEIHKDAEEGEASLFSPRSILGTDEEIKQLEDEMAFLEHREDEEIPTRVIDSGITAALAGTGRAEKTEAASPEADAPPEKSKSKKPTAKFASLKKTQLGMAVPEAFLEKTAPKKSDVSPPKAAEAATTGAEIDSVKNDAEPISLSGAMLLPSSYPDASIPISEQVTAPSRGGGAVSLARLVERARRDKRLLIGAGAALCASIVLIGVLLNTGDDPVAFPVKPAASTAQAVASSEKDAPAASTTPAAGSNAAPASSSVEAVAVTDVQPAQTSPVPEVAALKDASLNAVSSTSAERPETVSIQFQNVPDGASVKADGESVSLPLSLPWSKKVVKIVFNAEGYAPFRIGVVPDRDRDIPIRMKKARRHSKKKGKRSSGGPRKKGVALVSNPFTK